VGDAAAAPTITATLRPSDVEDWTPARVAGDVAAGGEGGGEVAAWLHREGRVELLQRDGALSLPLAARQWEIASLAPLERQGGAAWAAIGLKQMLNGGGAVVASTLLPAEGGLGSGFGSALSSSPALTAAATLSASGDFVAYCQPRPAAVTADGEAVPFEWSDGLLTVPLKRSAAAVHVRAHLPLGASLSEELGGEADSAEDERRVGPRAWRHLQRRVSSAAKLTSTVKHSLSTQAPVARLAAAIARRRSR